MEIIFSVLFLLGFWLYYRCIDNSASNHCNTYKVNWKKVNEDRIINDLSNSQINRNISRGKYDVGTIMTKSEIRANQEVTWEDFKKRHQNGNWN